jgi:hypothetical protein
MRRIKYEDLVEAAKKAKERAYLAGEFPERKIRKKPRDPEELRIIGEMVSARIRANPIRVNRENGRLIIPGISPDDL